MKIDKVPEFRKVDRRIRQEMARWGLPSLRISLGIIFLWFGFLKFFPDVSPAENMARDTMKSLTFGFVPTGLGMKILAAWECLIGLGLLFRFCMRLTLFLLALQMVGAMSPILLFPEQVFVKFPWVPTLEGQYIIKNLVLISAGLVLGASVEGPAKRTRRKKVGTDVPPWS